MAGFKKVRTTRGSHIVYKHKSLKDPVVLPKHKGKEVKKYQIRQIDKAIALLKTKELDRSF